MIFSTPQPTLIIVSGLPATGKSTLAREMRDALGWPLLAKDSIKECMADALPPTMEIDRSHSTLIGQQAIAVLFLVVRELLETGTSCLVEANFLPWLAQNDLEPLIRLARAKQVHCTLPADMVLERYRQRADSGTRHRVHADADALDELAERIRSGGGKPLPLDVPLLQVSMIDEYEPELPAIIDFCRS